MCIVKAGLCRRAACLYTIDGQVLAKYRRPGTSQDFHVSYSKDEGAQFTADSLILRRTIPFKGKELGSIAIVSDLTELQVKMRGYNEISARPSSFPSLPRCSFLPACCA